MKEIIEKVIDKVPDYENFEKSPKNVSFYVLLLMFLSYFVYSEFIKEDDCEEVRVANHQLTEWQSEYIKKLEGKLETYDHALQIQQGINKRIVEKTDSLLTQEGN